MEHSVLVSYGATRPEQVVPFANLVKWTSASRLWLGQGVALGAEQVAGWLAGLGIRVPIGIGVSVMPMRSPFAAAMEARSVGLTTGHAVVAAFGPGSADLQTGLLGRPYARPVAATREYVELVRRLVQGETVDITGAFYSLSAMALASCPAPPVEVGIGVLRPRMAIAAGEVADVAVCWLTSAAHIRQTLAPAIAGADRALSNPARVVAYVPVAVDRPGRDPIALAAAACAQHAQAPHYREALRAAGIDLDGLSLTAACQALIDHDVFLFGDAPSIAQKLDRYREAGVDEVVLNGLGVGHACGPRAAAEDLFDIIAALN